MKRAVRLLILGPAWIAIAAAVFLLSPLVLLLSWAADDGEAITLRDIAQVVGDLGEDMGLTS